MPVRRIRYPPASRPASVGGNGQPGAGRAVHAQPRALPRPVLASPRCVGVDVCIFDPDLDPDGRLAAALADTPPLP